MTPIRVQTKFQADVYRFVQRARAMLCSPVVLGACFVVAGLALGYTEEPGQGGLGPLLAAAGLWLGWPAKRG